MQAQIGGFFRVDGYLARIVPTEKGRLDLSDGGDFLRREDQGPPLPGLRARRRRGHPPLPDWRILTENVEKKLGFLQKPY